MVKSKKLRSAEDASALRAVTIFPLLIVAAALWGYFSPSSAGELTPYINWLLGIIMFGMGLTLTLPDFQLVVRRPLPILIGVVAQYLIMPSLAVGVSWALGLPPAVAAGVVLVGCAPGGTASNVISYLAKADVALSVTMTSISTLLAPILTPLLTKWLAGAYMPLDAGAMALSIVKMVLVPVIGGLILRVLLPKVVKRLLPFLPWISTLGIALVVAALVPGSAEAITSAGVLVLLAVVLHNLLGYALGYGFARLLKVPRRGARTVSIEVGMQNSGLAAGLARQYFSPEAALPGVVFSIWHNLSGALLAMFYRTTADRKGRKVLRQDAVTGARQGS